MEIKQINKNGGNKISFDFKNNFDIKTLKSFENQDQVRDFYKKIKKDQIKSNIFAIIITILLFFTAPFLSQWVEQLFF
ncbi:MAG: hypothetical protein PHW15_03415 [Patescibacteria group bacterium]|nr:hypothetical protein [Patescibacteria group bacterium]